MNIIILSFITAFLITFSAIPSIINIAKIKHLIDEPGERTSHLSNVPTLGGLGIFAGVIFSVTFWTPFEVFSELQYILCSFIIIFLIGAKDDILPLTPTKKFAGEILAALILVFKADVKLTSMYGIFGIDNIPDVVGIPLSVFTIILLINAVNLIDGINGLSGTIGTIIACTFGFWFYQTNSIELAVIAFALAGALVAFLKYNYTPAKIFMGDTGALLIGLICAILSIKFIEINKSLVHPWAIKSVPSVAVGIMIIPIFDTLRVFTLRILNGKSPFSPDRNHIHHLLIDLNLTHLQATGVLAFFNFLFIIMVFSLQHLGSLNLLLLELGIAIILTSLLYLASRQRRIAKTKMIHD